MAAVEPRRALANFFLVPGLGVCLLGAILFLSACAGSRAGTPQPAAIVPDDGVMFVFLREFSFEPRTQDIKDEHRIISCVKRAVLRHRPQQRIVPFDDFREVGFPNLPRTSVPRKPEFLSVVFNDVELRKRVDALRLRYVAFIGGVTAISEVEGGVSCAGYHPYGGCLGMWSWDKNTRVGASVLDLSRMAPVERITASASGTPWIAIVGAFPIGLPSNTEAAACDDLGTRVAKFLEGESPSQ